MEPSSDTISQRLIVKHRLLITGYRHWTDQETIRIALTAARTILGDHTTLVQGNCPNGGADLIAKTFWNLWQLPVESHPADFNKLGRRAGPLRNQHMVDLGATLCLAFQHTKSRGTKDCIRRATLAGIPVRIFNAQEEG